MSENKSINLNDFSFDFIEYSKESDILEIPKTGITYVFGGNGVGKSTISRKIYNWRKDEFHYFTYEENSNLVNNDLIVSKNQKNIDNRKKELDQLNKDICLKIDELFKKKLKLSSGSNLFKNFIKNQQSKVINNEYIIAKNNTLNFNFLDKNFLKDLKNSLSFYKKNNDLIDLGFNELNILVTKYNSIDKDDMFKLTEIKNILKTIEKEKDEFYDNIKKILDEEKFLFQKENIYEIIKNIDSLDKCILCNKKIESWDLVKKELEICIQNHKSNFKKNEEIKKILENINDFSDSFKKQFKNFDINYNSLTFIYENFNYLNSIIESILKELKNIIFLIEIEIFNIFNDEYNNHSSILNFLIESIEEIEKWESEKIENSEIIKEYNLIISFIEEKIGKGRLNINKNDNKILIRGIPIEGSNDLIEYLSTGERKFITFCFSLIFYILKNKNKTIIIDDPFSSYDTENEYNIIYIISHLVNTKKINFLIFTHSWQFISSQTMNFKNCFIKYFYTLEKSFFENNQNFVLKKINCISEKHKITSNNYLKKYFSNEHFIKWIRDENIKFINKFIENQHIENKYIMFIFSLLPIIRGYLKFTTGESPNVLNYLMHYINDEKKEYFCQNNYNKKFFDNLAEFFNLKVKIKCEKFYEKSKLFYEKIFNEIININLKKFENIDEITSDSIIDKQLKKLFWILYLRKNIEEKLLKKIENYKLSEKNINIYTLVEICLKNKKISPIDALIMKSKRILINCFSHFERLNNYIIPLFELDENFYKKILDYIGGIN